MVESSERQDLYVLLQVSKNASDQEIKKQYRILALKYHPDKNTSEDSTKHFQKLQEAYQILMDPEKRKLYDQGLLDDEDFMETYAYFKKYEAQVTEEDIESFSKTYPGSEAENEDLISFYNKFEGDVTNLLEFIPLSQNNDIKRLIKALDQLIKDKKIKSTKLYKQTKSKVKKLNEELDQEEMKELEEIIQANKNKRENQFQNLFEKYAGKSKVKQPMLLCDKPKKRKIR